MPNERQPIDILLATGRKHMTQAEIEARREQEPPPAPADNIKPPEYLSAKQRTEFFELAEELRELRVFGNVDAGELGRYVVAHSMYARYTKLLRTLPKKKRARLRELRLKLAEEEGRTAAPDEAVDDEDVALELETVSYTHLDVYKRQGERRVRAWTTRRPLRPPRRRAEKVGIAMEVNLKIELKATDRLVVEGALGMLESIKNDHPDLFQQVEMVIRC